jgi:hypothetical protein
MYKIYYSDLLSPLYELVNILKNLYYKIRRMLFWAWKMRNNHDFDGEFIYEAIYLKLSRLHSFMLDNGHLEWNCSNSNLMRKLCEAKGIAKKLSEFSYSRHYTRFAKVYRRAYESNCWLDETRKTLYPNARIVTHSLYIKFLTSAIKSDNAEKYEDKKRLYYLLDKYLEHWWD